MKQKGRRRELTHPNLSSAKVHKEWRFTSTTKTHFYGEVSFWTASYHLVLFNKAKSSATFT
jgi:hypothetical protein